MNTATAHEKASTEKDPNRASNFANHAADPIRLAYVWCTVQGQAGAPWLANQDIADFANKVGAPRPASSLSPSQTGTLHFAGPSVPAFAELRLARSDIEFMRFDKTSITSGSGRGGVPLMSKFVVRGLIPTFYALWRRGLLSQTAQFALRPHHGRCPKAEEQEPAVLSEHWRWVSQTRGELAAYDGSGTGEGLPKEANAERQMTFATALAHEPRVIPANELSLALLPSPPRSVQADRNKPARKLLIGELSALAVVEFSANESTRASVRMNTSDPHAPSPQISAGIVVQGEYSDQRKLSRIAQAFEHFVAHCFLLYRAQEIIDRMRKLALDETVDPASTEALWRDFLDVVEPLWAPGDCDGIDNAVLAALEADARLNSRWLLALQRGSQLFNFASQRRHR